MKKTCIVILTLLFTSISTFAQDLNCTVDVITTQVQVTNKQIFEDLKNSIIQFMNNRKWIAGTVAPNEKINCNIVFEITKFEIDQIQANINIQSSRTVYNSSYNTKVFSYLDNAVVFKYAQFQSLEFQENSYTSNLTSLLGFYANVIIGLDFDTYQLNGGDPYFAKALNIRDVANIGTGQAGGWQSNAGNGSRNKYFLIDNILDPRFKPLRSALYRYHIKGLDVMSTDMESARTEIYQCVKDLKLVYDALPNAYLLKLFFNSKTEELIQVFNQASPSIKTKVIELLSKMDPSNRSQYEEGILKTQN
ncbi:MAG: DUF4835 family protein [Bacteroidetes bacterium]|jgi:uncharacterized membrane protein|nr:DUF4835 family protein [Bacteroidota bacterium]